MTDEVGTANNEELANYVIEGARSGRSRCKTCRRAIAKGSLRIGVLIEGPFGAGYLWHHLKCLARSRPEDVEAAYEQQAWTNAKVPPKGVPAIEKLRALKNEAQRKRQERREMPYVELAPSGRSKCKLCGEAIADGAPRVVMGREVSFGQQVRTAPVKVHPQCVGAELEREDTAEKREGLEDALRANSKGVDGGVVDGVINEI